MLSNVADDRVASRQMRCDTPPRMEDVNDRDSSDDDAPADMDDIEIVEEYDEIPSDFSEEEEEHEEAIAAGEDELPLDSAEVSFTAHQGSAFVCAVSGDSRYIVTGGEDDRGCVWHLDTGELVFECGGHADSVTCAAFNHDSTLVATADMGGSLHVWNVESCQQIWEFDIGVDLNWIDWHQQANVLLAGTLDGMLWMWQIPGGQCKNLVGPGASCGAGRFLSDGRRAAAGYDDGSVRVWDLKGAHTLFSQAHPGGPVTCLDTAGDLVASAATDVRLLQASTGRNLAAFTLATSAGDEACTVEAVCIDGAQRILAAGLLSGRLSLWDLGSQAERECCIHPAGVTRALWRGPHTVVTGCLDGVVRAWDIRTPQEPAVCWRAHRHDILDLALSPDGQRVVSVSDGGMCTVHKFAMPE